MNSHPYLLPRCGLHRLVLSAFVLAAVPAAAFADTFPSRPVRMVVGFSAGGTTDVLARLMAHQMGKALGQAVVIDNKPGASGTIAANAVAKAVPDGYTIMFTTSTVHGIVPSLFKKLPYDTAKDFTPIALVSKSTMVLVANNGLKANTVQELIADAKQRPGALTYASSGPGSTFHLVATMFSRQACIEMLHVPFKGGGTAMPAVLSGEVNLAFDNIASTRTLIAGQKLKAIAVTSARRSPALPNVPTISESGLPDFVLSSWGGLVAPAGTPAEVIARLNDAANRALRSEEVRDALLKGDTDPQGGTPQAFAQFIEAEQKTWGEAARLSGITLD